MRSNLIYGGLLVICLWVIVIEASETGDERDNLPAQSARSLFVLPKIFDFNLFKQLFNKHYPSLVQELARQKLFLARAFSAFVSAVNYKHWRSDYYLSINHLSDQTPEELDKRINKRLAEDFGDAIFEGKKEDKIEALDQEDVKRELKSILEEGDKAGLREAAEEISKSTLINSRRKRNVNTRDISLDDLILASEMTGVQNEKLVRSVPSNNPNYEPPELVSFGAENEQNDDELSEMDLNIIKSSRGLGFLSSMKNKLVSAFNTKTSDKNPKSRRSEGDKVYVDHRESNCLPKVRNQGNCGSCYVFSTISLLEWAHCMRTGKLINFSEQYIVDCGPKLHGSGIDGCDGGHESSVIDFVKKYGLELQKDYPYYANQGVCPYSNYTNPKAIGYLRVKDISLKRISVRKIEKTLMEKPILATIEAPPDFSYYGGGIHSGKECKEADWHAMLLVGSGRQDGQEYWLFRNSYRSSWGENGYFKLRKSSPCFTGRFSKTLNRGFENLYEKNPHYRRSVKKYEEDYY